MNTSLKTLRLLPLLALPALFSSCGGGSSEDHSAASKHLEPVSVETTQASRETIQLSNETTGTVRSKNRASIAPKVTGEIAEIHVITGQKVEKNELLVKISALEITSKLQSAQASVDKVRRDLKREQDLLESGASTPEMVNDLKDQLRITEAMKSEAETILSYTEIRAPFGGVITRKYANEGDLALPGNQLLEIEDLSSLRIESDVPEALGVGLEIGTEIEVYIAGIDGPLVGKVEEIAPAADPVSRTFPAKISLPNHPTLKSGQFAKVRIPTGSVEAILVNKGAISNWGQIERVFVIEDGHIHMRIVKTGTQHGAKTEILSGLKGDEKLAVRVDTPLIDGSPIQ